MGSFASVFQNESQPTMKVLLFVALAIAAVMAEPEAEPTPEAAPEAAADAWYGYYGYGRRWGGYPYRGYCGYYRGKRSPDAEAEPTAAAEADPEADAAADAWYGYYGHPAYYGYRAYGYGYGLGYYGHRWGGYYGYPYARAYGYHYLGKRSAEAAPEADAEPWYYGRWGGYYGYPYRGYYGYGYGRRYWWQTISVKINILAIFIPLLSFPTDTTALYITAI